MWASLTKGKAAVIGEVAAEVLRRAPHGYKNHVALTDGERALQSLVTQKLQVTLILDLLHVLEKLWKAAYVFHTEGSAEAELWVRLRAQKIFRRARQPSRTGYSSDGYQTPVSRQQAKDVDRHSQLFLPQPWSHAL